MAAPDLNLLVALDVVLTEGNVARAARRLRLSPSAMSRQLARLRLATGDPLLVRAGRGLVPTPRALELRERVGRIVDEARAALRPAEAVDIAAVARTFTIRASEGFAENFAPRLLARIEPEAPSLRLCFLPKPDKEGGALRDGRVDLETGVVGEAMGPEIRSQALFGDRWIGVVRIGHPISRSAITPGAYAAARHVMVSRRGLEHGPVDDALRPVGLEREVAAIVGGYSAALAIVRSSDLVATVPERHTGILRDAMFSFPLPVAVPELRISLLWHPRLDADPAHRWLRNCVREVCR